MRLGPYSKTFTSALRNSDRDNNAPGRGKRGFPGDPTQGVQFRSPLGELRSHMPQLRPITAKINKVEIRFKGLQGTPPPHENLLCQAAGVDTAGSVRLCRVSLHWPGQELNIGGGVHGWTRDSMFVKELDLRIVTWPHLRFNPISAPHCVTLGSCTTSLPSEAFLPIK